MKNKLLMTAIIGLLLTAACADQPRSDGPGTGGSGTTVPDQEPGDIVYRPIEPEGDVGGEPLPAAGERLISQSGNQLEIGFWMGTDACYAVEEVQVTEEEDRVSVGIMVALREGVEACIDIAEARSITVDLSEPLGDRTLDVGGVILAP